MSLVAELDPDAGSIALPFDQFMPTFDDSEVLDLATQLEAASCAGDQGVHYRIPARDTPPEYSQDTLDGPWTIAQAERFAFVRPMTDADLRGNGVVGAPEAGPAVERTDTVLADIPAESPHREIVEDCFAANEITDRFGSAQSPSGPWMTEMSAAVTAAQASDEADALRSELRACYEQRGIAVDTSAFDAGRLGDTAGVAGADSSLIDAQQIELAIAVVECKNDVGYTERAAALVAQAQAPVVVAYLDELRAFATELESTRDEAEQIITEHADLTTTW
ncbi:hypothetical protein [Cellulomonas sp. SLBN-39]|uniref:hypothetical protein n=1 Tax=Cellulomonas sp. SLBN-39 TaxID=2768446 RepID=UPI00135B11DE|nr:hypothetical protein [Cellulomonas sp. SLBN-39]